MSPNESASSFLSNRIRGANQEARCARTGWDIRECVMSAEGTNNGVIILTFIQKFN
ncbi:MAG: hypothetical protein HW407_1465, partial [Bacteroidetes bacterium]|nr:hypothetical protein [Bacteroidota bacterium]